MFTTYTDTSSQQAGLWPRFSTSLMRRAGSTHIEDSSEVHAPSVLRTSKLIQQSFELADFTESFEYSFSDRIGDERGDESDDEAAGKERPENGRRHSSPVDSNFILYTPDEERAVIKVLDRRLVLFIALLYMLSFLDRSSTFNLINGGTGISRLIQDRYWQCKDCGLI